MVVGGGLRGDGTTAVGTGPETPEALAGDQGGELLPILLAEGQPQSNASLDGALGLVVIPELSPLLIGLLIVVDEGLEPPPKVVGVISFPW